MELSDGARTLAAILVLSLVTVETGGLYLVRLVRGAAPATPFQLRFARAGHAHAGVLLILSLVGLLYAEAVALDTDATGLLARSGVPIAAILMPAGFFFSSLGKDVNEPNRAIGLVYAGGLILAAGLIALGVGLLTAS